MLIKLNKLAKICLFRKMRVNLRANSLHPASRKPQIPLQR